MTLLSLAKVDSIYFSAPPFSVHGFHPQGNLMAQDVCCDLHILVPGRREKEMTKAKGYSV